MSDTIVYDKYEYQGKGVWASTPIQKVTKIGPHMFEGRHDLVYSWYTDSVSVDSKIEETWEMAVMYAEYGNNDPGTEVDVIHADSVS